MALPYITLDAGNIESEHICCAFSDKKCQQGYQMKKAWLRQEFDKGYVFRRLDARAKVFLEYGPAEMAWVPVDAPNYLWMNCFWVSGQYKGCGHAKALLASAMDDAARQNRYGLATVAGKKKIHFMSDGAWLIRQGFEVCATLPSGFCLLVKRLTPDAPLPVFRASSIDGTCPNNHGVTVYYSNRCPFAEYHVNTSLHETTRKRGIPLTVIKLESMEQARNAPTPGTIFSLFYKGKFVTTDMSVCMDTRFDKIIN